MKKHTIKYIVGVFTLLLAMSTTACGTQTIKPGGSLEINISKLSDKATFYPLNVDGTKMEVLAMLDSGGQPRVALNTCQVCYPSGKGYFKDVDGLLECQKCGNQYIADQIEEGVDGCSPWAVPEYGKTEKDGKIFVEYEFLNESKSLFANWKK